VPIIGTDFVEVSPIGKSSQERVLRNNQVEKLLFFGCYLFKR
jgi:hypothetical protein